MGMAAALTGGSVEALCAGNQIGGAGPVVAAPVEHAWDGAEAKFGGGAAGNGVHEVGALGWLGWAVPLRIHGTEICHFWEVLRCRCRVFIAELYA